MKTVSYQKAVVAIGTFMDQHPHKINAFDASLILAYLFDVQKETALGDLMEYRGKKLGHTGGEFSSVFRGL